MKRLIPTILISTVILFVWNAISWMALPFHGNALNTLPESVMDTQTLQSTLTKDGVYHYPGFDTKDMEAKVKTGPRISLMVYKQGKTELFDPVLFGMSFLYNLISVVLLVLVLSKLQDKSFKNILITSVMLGLMIGFMSDLPQMNWFLFPLEFTLAYVLDYVISFALIGAFIGVFAVDSKKEMVTA